MKDILCTLCGNPIKSTDTVCQCGGPQPDGCVLAQHGVRDKLREIEAWQKQIDKENK